MEHSRVQRVAHGEHKEVINSEVKSDTTSGVIIIIKIGQRLSVLRFIPLGLEVSRVEIHRFSMIFLRTGSWQTISRRSGCTSSIGRPYIP